MDLKFYNTLSRSIEIFSPLKGRCVSLYTCGPTLYDDPHIGNFRSFLFFDLLKRYLLFLGYEVIHVMNLTDVDDRIIHRCAEKGIFLKKLTAEFKDNFFHGIRTLGILPATFYPAATDHISEIQKLIEILLEKGHAYKTKSGSVFFKLSSFPAYGNLSKIDVSNLTRTDRVLSDHYEKEHVRDFALWKGWKEEDGDVGWDSPWGRGRPGWHIECSAMSMEYLGQEFDIHCGGVDLIFPHHENEIAQSVCVTGKQFARLWLHCEFLLIDGTKMSKSLGNYYTLDDLVNRGISPSSIRYLLTTSHYRQKINLSFKHLDAAAKSVERLHDFRRRLVLLAGSDDLTCEPGFHPKVMDRFKEAMNDDLNISEAMGVVFTWLRGINRRLDGNQVSPEEALNLLSVVRDLDLVLGIFFPHEVRLSQEDWNLIHEREETRRKKDWKRADEIRDYFLKRRIQLEDTPTGTVVKKIHSIPGN